MMSMALDHISSYKHPDEQKHQEEHLLQHLEKSLLQHLDKSLLQHLDKYLLQKNHQCHLEPEVLPEPVPVHGPYLVDEDF